ncbi:MAG: NAD(P)-dependent oxidoreductase [Holosporales bacterium]|jgi:nucleoside-diphosphate-sugar epimerase|nr:NAD(P)-dependent oxidoreductase [Holosporales bacterium]
MSQSTCKKVLITGAAGLIGRSVAGHLVHAGYDVTGLIRTPPKGKPPPFKYFVHDLACPLQINEHFDAIVHTAASVGYDYDFQTFKANNIDATANMAEFAKAKGLRFIYLSSTSVYGRVEGREGGGGK